MEFGFTEREARFLVTVMRFGGLCVPRQYARFAGTAYGEKVNAFFDRLVRRGYASACACLHNRARLYHVRYRPLYAAIGEARSRYRRPVPAGRAVERLMRLDGVLAHADLRWLVTERDKVEFCRAAAPALPVERLPHLTTGTGPRRRVRLFPDELPMGLDGSGRLELLYVVTDPFDDAFRATLQRHGDLLAGLPRWTVRLLFPRHLAGLMRDYEAAFHHELATPMSSPTLDELRWYFEQLTSGGATWLRQPSDARGRRARGAFGALRFRVLYRRWRPDGDAAFDVVSSPAIREALAAGTGCLESELLPLGYGHLSPLVSHVRLSRKGVEKGAAEGEQGSARPQPLGIDAAEDVSAQCARDWYRLVKAWKAQSRQ